MYITVKTALAVLKKRKGQSALIGIIIILISTLLYTGLSMMSQASPFTEMFERANATESMLIMTGSADGFNEVSAWWNARPEVEETLSYSALMTNGEFELNGRVETELMLFTEYVEGSELDLLYRDDEELAKVPEGNQVLVNYNFAKNRELEIGDSILFRYANEAYAFEVAGYVVDPQFSTAFVNPSRCFIAPEFFERQGIVRDTTLMAVKYHNIAEVDDLALYDAYRAEIYGSSNAIFLDYATIKNSYNIIFGVISAILLAVSLFILAIVVFIIRNTIHNLILHQYREIGVKKVIGFTNKQIRSSLLLIYGLIAFGAAAVGASIGLPIRKMVNEGISYDIQVGLHTPIDGFIPLTIALIVGLVLLFAYLATHRTNQIKPIQAIKYGMPERKVSGNPISIVGTKRAPLSLLLAFKHLFKSRSKTLTTTLTITLLIYVALLISNIGNTLTDGDHLTTYLMGLKVGDFAVADHTEAAVLDAQEMLHEMDGVEGVIYLENDMSESTQTLDGNSLALVGQMIYGDIPSDFIILKEGRQPVGANEIALCTTVVQATGKSTGDYILIDNGNERIAYLVSGTYNSILYSGNSYIMLHESIPADLASEAKLFWGYSNDQALSIVEMNLAANQLLGEGVTVSNYDANVKNILSTLSSFPIAIQSLLIIFLIISGIIILNATIMDINHSIKDYGIMKSIGFSNGLITRVLVLRTLIMTVLGSAIGFAASILTVNTVMQGVFAVTPFSAIELPVMFDYAGSLTLWTLILLISITATLIPARKIGRISPRQLISE